MADIECHLLAEIDRVVNSPYPTQLKCLRDIVCCKCSETTISRCLHLRSCALDRLAVCLIEGLNQWPYVLDIITSLASTIILRDALLRQAPGLIHELAEQAIKTENARSKYTRAVVAVLSHPLPDNVTLPASVQVLFMRLVDNAVEHPSTATVKPLNMLFRGTSTLLLGLLSNDVLLRFESQMLGILYSSVRKSNQETDQHLTLRCLAAISVVAKAADERLMLTNSFYETQELLASTQQDSSRWNASEMRKFFLDGESVPKTIRLLVLQALSACSSSGGSLDERAEVLAHVNDLVAVIPQNFRDNWCAANGQMIQKLQAKAVAAEHGELRLKLLSFVCQLCKPVFLQLATVESIRKTTSDLGLLLSANVAADASAWYYCIGATIDIATLERLVHNLARFSSDVNPDTLVLSATPMSELLDRMMMLAQENSDIAEAAMVALSTSSLHNDLLELSSKIKQCRKSSPLDSMAPYCNTLYHNSLCRIGLRLSDFLLNMQMAAESSRVIPTATTHALLELHATSAKDPTACRHRHLETKPQYRPLSIVEHQGTPEANGSDWRGALQSFLASGVTAEYNALSAIFSKACEDLENRCTDVEQPLQEEKAAHLCLREQYNHLQEDYAALETQSIDTKLRCDSLEAEWKNSLRDLETAREDSDCLIRRVGELEENLRISAISAEAKISELRTARDKDKLDNASAAAKKQEEFEDLQERQQELERDAEIRSQELTDLRHSIRAANAAKDDLQTRLDEACLENENKRAEVEALRMNSESHASNSSKLNSDLDALIQQSEQQRQNYEQSMEQLKEENRQNQQTVNAAHNETMDKLAAQHGEEAARYESELSSTKEALAGARARHTEELARRQDDMDDAQSQIDRLLQKCKQKDQQIADANAMRANLMAAMGIAPAAEATHMSSLPHRSRKSIHKAPHDRLDQSFPHLDSGGIRETRERNEQDSNAPNDPAEKGPTPKRLRSRRSLKVHSPVRSRSSMDTHSTRMSAPGRASANRQPLSNVSANHSPKKPARTPSSKLQAKKIGNDFDETTLDGIEMIGHGTSMQMDMDMVLSGMLADDMQRDTSTTNNTSSHSLHASPPTIQRRRTPLSTFHRSRAVRRIKAQKKALSVTPFQKMSNALRQGESHGLPTPETRPVLQRPREKPVARPVKLQYADLPDLKVKLLRIPDDWGTLQIHNHLSGYGSIDLIEVNEATRARPRSAYVIFKPPPRDESWVNANLVVKDNDGNRHNVKCVVDDWKHEQIRQANVPSPVEGSLIEFSAGIMQQEDRMLMLFTAAQSSPWGSPRVVANNSFNRLEVCFSLFVDTDEHNIVRHYKLLINFAQVKNASLSPSKDGCILVFTVEKPPILFRRATTVQETHERDSLYWRESQLWYRQTGIGIRPDFKDQVTQLQKEDAILDLGRWLTYRLIFGDNDTEALDSISQALISHNIDLKPAVTDFASAKSEELWSWNADNQHADGDARGFRGSLAMHLMSPSPVHLASKVRYQLEVCLSIGVLNESNINADFIQKLAKMADSDAERMTKVLEKIADNGERIYDPMEIFRLQGLVKVSTKKMPRYCAMVPGAVVTPSTIYLSTPVMETSNRVIRKYAENGDRFLRVKFTDERYRGKIKAGDDKTMSEVLTRVYRTMKNGIKIGDRLYEFLAFGNAQFREHGAYFFAPTHSLTTAKMRQWMGDFSKIEVVAKYASRIGQCFSTTRAVSLPVTLETVPDIWHNECCFTDGVGKISHFLARMIAEEHMMPHSDEIYPSVFQFRLGGCKGVLAVDPSLPSGTIHVRPSQQKFLAKYKGLEVCRISQYSSANLNVQIILVLNALGVKSWTFQTKMQKALDDILAAMTDQYKAIEQLSRNVDSSQTTLILANMIFDGFMDANDPFMISCLRLWRAWMLKYLKEKARIPVEQGAFVLGCVDETATLKGHRNEHLSTDSSLLDQAQLPEIFLQVSDPDHKGRYKIIEGICVLTRNPSLHPGDARVVRAVDVEALHHLKNCVVLPQTGDRDLASMCSGGDLDGDDYLVIWDTELIPSEWNYPPMDYAAPEPIKSKGPVTVGDMTAFYVQHLKHDNLGRIAMAHRYHADDSDDGVKDPKCLELAQLHSLAVDYAKTGKPAEFPRRLRVRKHPHWAETGKKPTYHSKKVLGKLYDMVQRQDPEPAWDLPFDQRVLDRHTPNEQMLQDAREVKKQYDEAIRRVMAQHGIQRELEAWTTFVLKHNDDVNDYKFAETLSETITALKDCYRELCFEKAGTTRQEPEWSKLSAFIVAMYAVTAEETKTWRLRKEQGVDSVHAADQPYMSFPWIFAKELGYIAKGRSPGAYALQRMNETRPVQKKQANMLALSQDDLPPELSVVNNGEERIVRGGDVLNFSRAESTPPSVRSNSADGIHERDEDVPENAASSTSGGQKTAEGTPPGSPEYTSEESSAASQTDMAPSQAAAHTMSVPALGPAAQDPAVSDAGQGNEVVEEVFIQSTGVPSALDALDALMGT